jgi:hypothetical protein
MNLYAHLNTAPAAQNARFSGVAAPASLARFLGGRGLVQPDQVSELNSLEYRLGRASWTVEALPSGLVLRVNLRETREDSWLLEIQAGPPVRPTVVRRRALQAHELDHAARRCLELAVELHGFLSTLYGEIAWAVDRDPGAGGGTGEPRAT